MTRIFTASGKLVPGAPRLASFEQITDAMGTTPKSPEPRRYRNGSRPPPQHEANYPERLFQPEIKPADVIPGRRWPVLALRIERKEKPAPAAPRRPTLTLKGLK